VVVVAELGSRKELASLLALSDLRIPHAHAIGLAIAGVLVLEGALGEAHATRATEFANRIGFAGLFTSGVEFATLAAFVGGRIPTAAFEFVVETFVFVTTSDALLSARETDEAFRFGTRTVPFALGVRFAFGVTLAVFALLEAATTVPGAEGVGEASILDEEAAALVARNIQEHDVFAHVSISETFRHGLLGASCTANLLILIPHTFRVELALGFINPSVIAVSLASRVGTVVVADFRITPNTNVADRVATTIDLETEHHGVGDVDHNRLRIVAAASVSNGTSGDVDPSRLVGDELVHVSAIVLRSILTGETVIADTDGGTEDGEGTTNDEVSGGNRLSLCRSEDDFRQEVGAVDGVTIVGSLGCEETSDSVGTESGERQALEIVLLLGRTRVANTGILVAVSLTLTLRTLLDTDQSCAVPEAALIPVAGEFVFMLGFAAATARVVETPLATRIFETSSFVGILVGILADGEAAESGRPLAFDWIGVALRLGGVETADGLASEVLPFAGRITKTFSAVVGDGALAVTVVTEWLSTRTIEAARRISGASSRDVVIAHVGALTRAVHVGSSSRCVPSAHGGLVAVTLNETPAIRKAEVLEVVEAACRIFHALLFGEAGITVSAVHLAGAVPVVAHVVQEASLLLSRPVASGALFDTASEEFVPHAVIRVLIAVFFGSSTRSALSAALSVVEPEAETFFDTSALVVHFSTLGRALELKLIVLAKRIFNTLNGCVTLAEAAAVAVRINGFVTVPAAELITIASDVVHHDLAVLTAKFLISVPSANSGVGGIGASGFSRIEVASFLAGTLAGGFDVQVTFVAGASLVEDVDGPQECVGTSRIDVVRRLTSLTVEGLRERRPSGDVTDSVVEVVATTRLGVGEDGSFDGREGGALLAGVAREDDEDDVDVTHHTLNDSLELVDRATSEGAHVVNSEVINLLEDELILLSFVLLPNTSRRFDRVTECAVLCPTFASDTSFVVPFPLALSVSIARSLIVDELVAKVAGSVAVTISGGSSKRLPTAARIAETFSDVVVEVALGVAYSILVIPFASGVIETAILAAVPRAALAAFVHVEVVPVALSIQHTLVLSIIQAHLVDASISQVAPFAISVSLALGVVCGVSSAEVAAKSATVVVRLVTSDVADGIGRAVCGSEERISRAVHGTVVRIPLIPDAAIVSGASRLLLVEDVTTSLASLVGGIGPCSVVGPKTVVIVDALRLVSVAAALLLATFTSLIPLATVLVFREGGRHAASDGWVSSLALDVALCRPSRVGETSGMPVADRISCASCLVLVGTAARLTRTIQEFASKFESVTIDDGDAG
jgi:hypothetical protein